MRACSGIFRGKRSAIVLAFQWACGACETRIGAGISLPLATTHFTVVVSTGGICKDNLDRGKEGKGGGGGGWKCRDFISPLRSCRKERRKKDRWETGIWGISLSLSLPFHFLLLGPLIQLSLQQQKSVLFRNPRTALFLSCQ